MTRSLIAFLLAGSLAAFGQVGRSGGSPSRPPSGTPETGSGAGMGRNIGVPGSVSQSQRMSQTQQPLKDAQINSGAFRMLEQKTGMTSQQLQALYTQSGAKNFGEFASAIVVSKNLGLDMQRVLDGLKTASLGRTLENLGVDKKKAEDEIKKAQKEAKDAGQVS
jgi:hypothetical protein